MTLELAIALAGLDRLQSSVVFTASSSWQMPVLINEASRPV